MVTFTLQRQNLELSQDGGHALQKSSVLPGLSQEKSPVLCERANLGVGVEPDAGDLVTRKAFVTWER